MQTKGWVNERNLLYLLIAGIVVFVIILIVANPLGPGLGVSDSPARAALLWAFAIFVCVPWAWLWIYKFAQHSEWLAQAGRYMPGTKYPVFAPYSLVAIGIVGALFAVAGITDIAKLDLQAMVIAASAALFGGPVSFFGLLVGQVIARGMLNPVWVGGNASTIASLVPYSVFDASIWAYAGYNYFRFVHSRGNRAFIPAFLTAWILSEPIHQLFWFMSYVIMNPYEAFVTKAAADWILPYGPLLLPYWVLSAVFFVPVGFLAGEAARRALTAGRGSRQAAST
jgi:hypothetical protein